MVSAFEQARQTFQNFPREIFDLWLDDRIRTNGWPPSGLEWAGFLCQQSVEFWQSLKWNKERIILTPEKLSQTSLQIAIQMLEANLMSKNNLLAVYLPDSKQRFQSISEFVQANGEFPKPLILLERQDEFEVVDGNHRVGVLLALTKTSYGKTLLANGIEAWIGRK